jgi:predicted TIM-barrel enzyme
MERRTDARRGPRTLADLFPYKPIFGMLHMPALPTAPENTMTMDQLIYFALAETKKLERAGLDAVIVENVGDAPFFRARHSTLSPWLQIW